MLVFPCGCVCMSLCWYIHVGVCLCVTEEKEDKGEEECSFCIGRIEKKMCEIMKLIK